MSLSKKEAYEIVYKDLISKDNTSLFRGNYDAVNGSAAFMHGISTVIENIAFHVGEEAQYEFDNMFTHNMVLSRKRARYIKYQKTMKYKFRRKFQRIRACLGFTKYKIKEGIKQRLS